MSSAKLGPVFAAVVALLAAGVIGWALRGSGSPSARVTSIASPVALGPSRTIDGIPVGFAHSEPGAVAAATSYVRTVSAALGGGYGARALAVLTVPPLSLKARSDAQQLQQGEAIVRGRSGVRLTGLWPLGYRVNSYSPTSAEVSVWSHGVSILGRPERLLSGYVTDTMSLRWAAGDWKVAAHSYRLSTAPPASGGTDARAPRAFAAGASGFRGFVDVP